MCGVHTAHQFIVSSSVTNELETANDNKQHCAPSKYISSNKRGMLGMKSAIGNFSSISKLIIHSHGDNCFTVWYRQAHVERSAFHIMFKLKRRVPHRSCHTIKFSVCVCAHETLQIKVHVMSVSFAFNIQSISLL